MSTNRPRFEDLLEQLQSCLLEMAGEAEGLLELALNALLQRDMAALSKVKEGDQVVDALELEVDERAMELLALQQPLAGDLRQILATLKISNDLERVGDHAVKIANASRRVVEHPPISDLPQMEEMAGQARGMLSDALRAWSRRDPELARQVRLRDDVVDALRTRCHRILISHMMEDPRRLTPALELIHVSQSLERVADLATNIAEETVFLVEGEVIRHGPETA
ncbi:MAG: phosphate transport system regulatory protein PhoU [Gemmatimonadales bacterium]|nr:MAG: phosphate transport system regulatory protein PhoU [Gemmatimonadales bacterium]